MRKREKTHLEGRVARSWAARGFLLPRAMAMFAGRCILRLAQRGGAGETLSPLLPRREEGGLPASSAVSVRELIVGRGSMGRPVVSCVCGPRLLHVVDEFRDFGTKAILHRSSAGRATNYLSVRARWGRKGLTALCEWREPSQQGLSLCSSSCSSRDRQRPCASSETTRCGGPPAVPVPASGLPTQRRGEPHHAVNGPRLDPTWAADEQPGRVSAACAGFQVLHGTGWRCPACGRAGNAAATCGDMNILSPSQHAGVVLPPNKLPGVTTAGC